MKPTIADQIWSWVLPARVPYWQNPLRWSSEENDYCFGPFLFSTSDYRPWACIFTSWGGGEDNDKPANLRMSVPWFGTLIIRLPRWMVPGPTLTRRFYGEPDPKLGGARNWYDDVEHHEYGFSISRSGTVGDSLYLQVQKGRSTLDSTTDKSWSCTLPWTEWRHVRHSYYGLSGEFIAEAPEWGFRLGLGSYEDFQKVKDSVPKMLFRFKDFDGEEIMATTFIEEREWHAGAGWFKWLSWFRKPIIQRTLSLEFSSEVGKRKGSWKGGTLGHSIEMERGRGGEFYEGHLSAFLRYCTKNDLTFVAIGDWPDDVKAEPPPLAGS